MSDHYLLRTRIRLKLAPAEGRKEARVRFDVRKLQSLEIRMKYNIEVKNRFEALGDIEDPEEEHHMILETCRACHLAVVAELVCLSDPKSYASGDLVPGGFNRAGLVEGWRPDKGQPLVLQVGGWALG